MKKSKQLLTYATDDTVKSGKIYEEGFISSIVLILSAFTTAVSGVLTIKDSDGDLVYTSSAQNVNGTRSIVSLDIPCEINSSFDFTLNAGAGGTGGTAKINMYIENR